jgi:hypothetical protein
MTFTCEWCNEMCERAWQIPTGQLDDAPFWVCKSCHSDYFDGLIDESDVESMTGQDRVI